MGIQKFMSDQHVEMFYEYSPKIAQLVDHICPRYIITSVGKDVFYQRPVYINNAGFSTRFVSLSSMPNPKSKDTFKQKYVHAFSIKPLIHLQESELREKELEGIKFESNEELQRKLPPGMRNPFFSENSISHVELQHKLFKEKLELGDQLIKNKVLKTHDSESDDEVEPQDEIFISNLPKHCDYYELKEF